MSRTYRKQYKNTRKPSLKPYNRACEQQTMRKYA